MVKKIGILSFANVINHGAYLQVYALKNFLSNHGSIVEVINYRNKTHIYIICTMAFPGSSH